MNTVNNLGNLTAKEMGLASCHICSRLSPVSLKNCPRCLAPLHLRKVNSIQRTWALLLTASLLYIPAMLYPVTTIYALGLVEASTLMGSVIHFFQSGSWPVAIVIFVASVAVPILKIIGLSYLLICVQFDRCHNRLQLTRLYRVVEFVGRWSMIDVFVVAILVALVHIGIFINIIPGLGIMAFAGVVVLTMFASMQFDPRLLWDEPAGKSAILKSSFIDQEGQHG